MSSFWNNRISISIFGESHGPSIGVVIDNLPPGEYIDMEKVLQFMARRAPKKTERPHREAKRICHRCSLVCCIIEQLVYRSVR